MRRSSMPNGQLFNTISNGYNTMMGYAAQIPHADRWAIVLYVRALERAQNAAAERPTSRPAPRADASSGEQVSALVRISASRREGQGRQARQRADRRSAPASPSCSSASRSADAARQRSHGRSQEQVVAVPPRVRHRLGVHLQHLRRHAVARDPAPPGARSLGHGRAPDLPRRWRGAFPLVFIAGLGVHHPAARRLQGPLLLGASRRARTRC